MPLPIIVWMAAGVGAAGVKLFKNVTTSESIIDRAVGRYREEKYDFFAKEDKVLPVIEEIAKTKLDAWSSYKRMFILLKKIENRPPTFSFKKHENLFLLSEDIATLTAVANLVEEIKEKKLDKIGTGLFSVITLMGGAAVLKEAEDNAETPKKKASVLEYFVSSAENSATLGKIEEYEVLNNLLRFPQLVEDKDLDSAKDKKMTKDEAFAFKEDLDKKSLAIADAEERVKRLAEMLDYLKDRIVKMYGVYTDMLDQLEKIAAKKSNYNDFTEEEKDKLSYALAVGFFLRELAKTDVITTNADIAIANRVELHKVLDKWHDLVPIEPVKCIR